MSSRWRRSRRPSGSRTARSPRCGWRSAESAPGRGAPGAPRLPCSARPASAASFAEAARQELAAATPHPMNAFKVELAQRAIVRALNTLTDGDR